jgi:hypothetical protein
MTIQNFNGSAAAGRTRFLGALAASLVFGAAMASPAALSGQQFVTDDAGIVDFRACQLEAWRGEIASWVLPACQILPRLELTAGVGLVQEEAERQLDYVLQAKYRLRELGASGLGIAVAVVAGVGFDPISQIFGEGALLPEYQLGVRAALVPERLHADLSWGGHTDVDLRGAGWTLGLAWTPPPFR